MRFNKWMDALHWIDLLGDVTKGIDQCLNLSSQAFQQRDSLSTLSTRLRRSEVGFHSSEIECGSHILSTINQTSASRTLRMIETDISLWFMWTSLGVINGDVRGERKSRTGNLPCMVIWGFALMIRLMLLLLLVYREGWKEVSSLDLFPCYRLRGNLIKCSTRLFERKPREWTADMIIDLLLIPRELVVDVVYLFGWIASKNFSVSGNNGKSIHALYGSIDGRYFYFNAHHLNCHLLATSCLNNLTNHFA